MKLVWMVRWPRPAQLARVDPNARCPVCGAEAGTIRCVVRNTKDGRTVFAQHTCKVCGARFHEAPVRAVKVGVVWEAVPRSELERLEEATAREATANIALRAARSTDSRTAAATDENVKAV